MIRFLCASELQRRDKLRHSLFTARAEQFVERLGWDLKVNEQGEEMDKYDRIDPFYIVIENPDGSHAGSLRLLPTVGETMIKDFFSSIVEISDYVDEAIWECTRFCVSRDASPRTSAMLLAAGAKFMQEFGLRSLIAVFDGRMKRVYERLQCSPCIVGCSDHSGYDLQVGVWDYDYHDYVKLLRHARIRDEEMELYFANSGIVRREFISLECEGSSHE